MNHSRLEPKHSTILEELPIKSILHHNGISFSSEGSELNYYTLIKTIDQICSEEFVRLNQVVREYEQALKLTPDSSEKETELGDYILVKFMRALEQLEMNIHSLHDECKETPKRLIGIHEQTEIKRLIKLVYDSLTLISQKQPKTYQGSETIQNALKPCYNALVNMHTYYEKKVGVDVLTLDELIHYYFQKVGKYVNIYHILRHPKLASDDPLLRLIMDKEVTYEGIIKKHENTEEYTPIFGESHTRKTAPKRWGKWLQTYSKRPEHETIPVRFFFLSDLAFVLFVISSIIVVTTFFNPYDTLHDIIMPLF